MTARDRRCEIIKAAEKLFTRGRFHEITLDDVVAEAGVGKGTVYKYFRDKDDLFFQTAMNGFDDLCVLLEGLKPVEGAFEDQLRDACGRIGAFFERRRPWFRLMQNEEWQLVKSGPSFRQQWQDHRQRMVKALARMIEQGSAQGNLRDDLSAEAMAALLLGMLRTVRREPELLENPDAPGLTVDLFLNGVLRPAQAGAAPSSVGQAAQCGGRA